MKIPLIVCGASGRMGREVIAMALQNDAFVLSACTTKSGHNLPIPAYDQLDSALKEHGPAVVIDFSHAHAARVHLQAAVEHRAPFLLATTGHGEDLKGFVELAAGVIPVVVAPNTSLLANLLIAFTALASSRLGTIDATILDIHHAHKKDAPSGTALELAKAITKARPGSDVPIHSMRKGTVAGEHTVYFFNDHDRLELTHRASDRRIFAEGALVAAQFLFGQRPGLYDMNDVLNLNLTIKK